MTQDEKNELIDLVDKMLKARAHMQMCQAFADDAQTELNDAKLKFGHARTAYETWFADHAGTLPTREVAL